ncbi:MAG: BMP family ABC transporter substrate-binding protein [Spirochaetaceae bacterium]|nr:MAG: BMP family ABC transporter substrate-binding protein [Spirochaetaceae bacterium]
MERIVAAAGVAVVVILTFAACGGQPGSADTETADFRIGVVLDVGGRGDKSFNDLAYDGLVLIAEEYGGYIADDLLQVSFGNTVELKYLEPREGGQDRERLLRVLAEDGFDLLFGVGFAFIDALPRVAADFPDTHFALIDGYIPDLDADSNITCIAFAEHEGSFVVGALAGMLIEDMGEGRVGFIGAMDIPLIHRFHGGFAAGAMYANPALRDSGMIIGRYIGQDPTAFHDPRSAERIATDLYSQDVRIVYHAAGESGAGVFEAAYDARRWAMGVDFDQGRVYQSANTAQERAIGERIVTSMLKRVDIAVHRLSSQFIDAGGFLAGGCVNFGLDNGGVGYAVNEYNRDMIEPYIERLEELRARVAAGEITVPASHTGIPEWLADTF